jgi:4-hydroxyphenylacetate 3-monooxygenase
MVVKGRIREAKTTTPLPPLAEAIRPFLGEIARRAAATEDERRVPDANIELIRKAGFVRALLPRQHGGDERDLWDYVQGIRTLATACPSTAWVTGVLNVHPASYCYFSTDVQAEILKNGPDTISCSSGSPQIKAKLTEGGVIVDGRGKWSSGCHHAEWALVGVRVPSVADPKYPERTYRDHMFWAHCSEYRIDDTWHVSGLAGTGSNDLVFDSLFVSSERLEQLDAVMFGYSSGAGTVDSWVARLPMAVPFSCFMPAVALGCADGMVEQFIKRQRTRKNAYTQAQGIHNPVGYMRLAEAVIEINALTAFFKSHVEMVQDFGRRGGRLTEQRMHEMIAPYSYVTKRAVEVVDKLFQASGSSAIAKFNPMQRYWRDAHAAGLHIASDHETALQHYGRCLIGLPPTPDL